MRKFILKSETRIDEPILPPVALIATHAAASLAMNSVEAANENVHACSARKCVEKFWNIPLRTGDRRYYDNFLYLFSFMALSGNDRIYK